MKEIFADKYMKILYDEKNDVLQSIWLPQTVEIVEDEDVKKEINNAIKILLELRPKYLLADDRQRFFPYSVELQKWVASSLANACASAGVKKFAILYPKEFIAKLSTELAAQEVQQRPYQLKFFSDFDEAMAWLIK